MPDARCTICRPSRQPLSAWWWLLLVGVLAGVPGDVRADTDLSDPATAVESGRKAMGKPNWYDRTNDDFRPVSVAPPRAPRWSPDLSLLDLLLRYLFWVILALVLAGLAYLAVRSFLLREASEAMRVEDSPGRQRADITRVEELPVALATRPEDYLDEARRRYRHGDFGLAIVYLFSHQLLQLDRRHWLRLVKGKTNRQYLREVRRSSVPAGQELAAITEQTMLLFEEFYFGKRLPPQGEIDAAWGRIDRFESLVEQNQVEGL